MPTSLEFRPSSTVRSIEVIVINDFAAIAGGSDRVALTEAAELARRGHRVTLLAGHGEPHEDLAAAGVSVRTTNQPTTIGDPDQLRAAARGIWNRASAALVREATSVADPGNTVIHVHGFTKVLSASVVRAAVRSGLPVVVTLHDYFVACPNGGFFNYQTNEICPLTPLSPQCVMTHCDARSYSRKLWRVGRSTVQRTLGVMPSGVSHFITPSRSAGKILEPYLPAEASLHVIPNAVAGPRRPLVDAAANRGFVFVGRLSQDKGPVFFARAARAAGVPAVFVGAGEQTDSVRRAYPAADLTGWLDPDAVTEIVRGARAVVSASLWYETQGLSTLEAAAHGVPAVVSDVGVLRENVEDGRTGLWFRGGDVESLREKLTTLADNPALARRLGTEAYERFWSGSWDLPTHLQKLETVYRAALADRSAPGTV